MSITQLRVPVQLQNFKTVRGHRDLRAKLWRQMQIQGISNSLISHQCMRLGPLRLMAQCTNYFCSWIMRYTTRNCDETGKKIVQKGGRKKVYYLRSFNLYHNHRVIRNRIDIFNFNNDGALFERDFYLMCSLKDLNFPDPFVIEYWSNATGKQTCTTRMILLKKNKHFPNSASFQSWYHSAMRDSFQVVTIPTYKPGNSIPEFIMVTSQNARKSFSQKGIVVGLKVITNAVMEQTVNGEQINIAIVYRLRPDQTIEIYFLALYPNQPIKIKQTNQIQQNKQTPKKSSIDMGLYKILKAFDKLLNRSTCTLVIDDTLQVVSTVKYFMDNRQKHQPNNNCSILNYVVDPSFFIIKQIPPSMAPAAKQLYSCYSYEQYEQKYKKQIQRAQSQQDRQALDLIHAHRHHYLRYIEKDACVGNWFGWQSQFMKNEERERLELICVLQQFTKKMRGISLLELNNVRVPFTNKLMFIKSRGYEAENYNRYRTAIYKNGFRNLMIQIYASYQLTFIMQGNAKVNYNHENSNSDNQTDVNIMTDMETIGPIFKSQLKQKQEDYQIVNNSRCGDLSGQQFRSYYQKIRSNYMSQYKSEVNDSVFDDSSSTLKNVIVSEIHQEQQTVEKTRKLNPQFATYQQLYPLQPATLIKIVDVYPQHLCLWDQGKVYTCKKNTNINTGQMKDEKNAKQEPVYSCSCNFQPIMGLPCKHIIKVCQKLKLEFDRYINPLWMLEESFSQFKERFWRARGLQVPKSGRKNTKRNCMRNR